MGTIKVGTLNVRGLRQPLKRAAVFVSLRSVACDVLFLQECHLCCEGDSILFSKGWDVGPSVWGVGEGKGDGVGILFRSHEWEVEDVVGVVPGRVICVDGRWRGIKFRAIGVYAPCRVGNRQGFFRQLEPLLYTNRLVLIGGDFNVDIEGEGGSELAQVMAGAGLVDMYRAFEPDTPGHTWKNSRGHSSRLDLLFVADTAKVQTCLLMPFWASDHCLVMGSVQVEGGLRGRGAWRLNQTMLRDPSFCTVFRQLYTGWRQLRTVYDTWAEWWEDTKKRVAIFCRQWGRDMAVRKRSKALRLSRVLCHAWKNKDQEGLREVSEALRTHYEAEARSYFIQAGKEALEQDERPTKYFFNSVRSRQKGSFIEGLKDGAQVVAAPERMLKVAKSFYGNLFQAREVRGDLMGGFLDAVADRLPEEEAVALEKKISLEEVEGAMLSLRVGVAPGGDGLPVEWYRTFWPVVGPDLVAVYREALEMGILPPSMRSGRITLLHKKGDRSDLVNWRPITLLTADYKILAKVIGLRLRRVMALVIHSDQTCGVPGRMCAMNLALVRDALAWAEQRQVPLALLSLDQEKAFDRVSHAFLFAVLERMGFGPGFMAMVRLLYKGASSQVAINGHFSEPIEQQGGVRQGCPLSPLLYVLYLEPLLEQLRSEQTFHGLHVPGGKGARIKVSAYADDATLFLSREEDFSAIGRVLVTFSEVTGARVNRKKSAVLCAGAWAGKTAVPGGFSLCQDGLKILGVTFWREGSAQRNWEMVLRKVQAKAERWGRRDLSLTGRVLAVNSDLLASLNHLAYVFPIPFMTGRRLERVIFTFIWGGRTEKVARVRMYMERKRGGRGVACAPLKTMAMYVAFLARLVREGEGHASALLARFWLGFSLRTVIPWSGTLPWSLDRPWHYQKAAEFLRDQSWCLADSLVLDHRKLYESWRDRCAAQSGDPVLRVADIEWTALQPTWLDGASKDLHWLGALGRLPVRERMYRHGSSHTPLCPVGCGGEETVQHALWSCPVAAQFWRRVSEWWTAEGGVALSRDLVLYGSGLRLIEPERVKSLWQVVSVAKCVVWGMRCECIRSQSPQILQKNLLHAFRVRLNKLKQGDDRGQGFVRAGIGGGEGGGFSGVTVAGHPWWPQRE